MATPGQLTALVADLTKTPPVTAATYYKALREAGLTSKSGRGSSAAKMTPTDAANLLIAIIVSPTAKDGPDVVRKVRSYRRRSIEGTLRKDTLHLIPGDDFGSFFDNLMRADVEETLQSTINLIPHSEFRESRAIKQLYKGGQVLGAAYDPASAAAQTSLNVTFDIDDEIIDIKVHRPYRDRENFVDGAFFSASDPSLDWGGLLVQKTLLGGAIFYICDLLRDNAEAQQ